MWEGLINCTVDEAKARLQGTCRPNALLASFGFAQTDKMFIQMQGNTVVVRRRTSLGDGTCPALVLTLHPRGEKTAVSASMVLGSNGIKPLLVSTGGLLILALVCALAILLSPFNSLAWAIGLTSLSLAGCWFAKSLLSFHQTRAESIQFIRNVWFGAESRGSSSTGVQLYQIAHRVETPQLPMPAILQDGQNLDISLPQSVEVILDKLRSYAQQHRAGVFERVECSESLFDIGVDGNLVRVRKVRLWNLFGFSSLSNLADFDFAIRLKIDVQDQDGKAVLRVFHATTVMRKLWMILLFTIVLPFGGAGALALLLLAIPSLFNTVALSWFTVMWLVFVGAWWTELESRASDRTEYLHLLGYLGQVFGKEIEPDRISIAKESSVPKQLY